MGFVVYDHGYRIKTPTETLYPPRGVEKLTEIKPAHKAADMEGKIHSEPPRFELPEWDNDRKKKSAAAAYSETGEQAPATQAAAVICAAQVMSHPVHSVLSTTHIRAVWEKMKHLELHYLVVINEQQQPLGVISDRALLEHGTESFNTVQSLITRKLIAAKPTTDIRRIALTFIEQETSCMPVVDEQDHVIGVVCRSDLLRLLISGAHAEDWA